MKKKFLAITAAVFFTISATFANDINPVPTTIVNELQRNFTAARQVEWKTTASFYKASFTLDGRSWDAFFSFAGNLIGTSRKLDINQLPISLTKELSNKGSADQVTDLIELLTDQGTEYFVTFGSGKNQKIYKSNGAAWSRY